MIYFVDKKWLLKTRRKVHISYAHLNLKILERYKQLTSITHHVYISKLQYKQLKEKTECSPEIWSLKNLNIKLCMISQIVSEKIK